MVGSPTSWKKIQSVCFAKHLLPSIKSGKEWAWSGFKIQRNRWKIQKKKFPETKIGEKGRKAPKTVNRKRITHENGIPGSGCSVSMRGTTPSTGLPDQLSFKSSEQGQKAESGEGGKGHIIDAGKCVQKLIFWK